MADIEKVKDLTRIAAELEGVSGLLEIMAIYLESILESPPAVDVLSGAIICDAVRAISDQCKKLSDDVSTHDLIQIRQKANA